MIVLIHEPFELAFVSIGRYISLRKVLLGWKRHALEIHLIAFWSVLVGKKPLQPGYLCDAKTNWNT